MSNSPKHRFQVHLGGIIDILSHHLYSGPQVFVRELLQNAVDAVRGRAEADPTFAPANGLITFELTGSGKSATLAVTDNGVGLTEAEAHEFLATIGQSIKRDELGRSREGFIGQFGIGLLSCFMVAEEIVVISRSASRGIGGGSLSPAIEWRGRPDGTYSLRTLDEDVAPGTQAYLRARPECDGLFTPRRITHLIAHYGQYLPTCVKVTVGSKTSDMTQTPPWTLLNGTGRDSLLDYGREAFGVNFIDAVPLHSAAGGVEGVAYVLPKAVSASSRQQHRIYLKGMLLSEQGEKLLPDWAFFVRCIVNVTGLRPTASRESFYEDEALEQARTTLGQVLREYLLDLARTDPNRLTRLVSIHDMAIKSLAVHDDDSFRVFGPLLPVETSAGRMTLREVRRRDARIRYAPTVDDFRQIARVAAAQRLCVVNAGYSFVEDLLAKLGESDPDVALEIIDASTLAASFSEPSDAEAVPFARLLEVAAVTLGAFNVGVELRAFEPVSIPVLFTNDAESLIYRETKRNREVGDTALGGVLDDLFAGDRQPPQCRLIFNTTNPLVRQVAAVGDRKLVRSIVGTLFTQALLLGHHPLTAQELGLLNGSLGELIAAAVRDVSPDEGRYR